MQQAMAEMCAFREDRMIESALPDPRDHVITPQRNIQGKCCSRIRRARGSCNWQSPVLHVRLLIRRLLGQCDLAQLGWISWNNFNHRLHIVQDRTGTQKEHFWNSNELGIALDINSLFSTTQKGTVGIFQCSQYFWTLDPRANSCAMIHTVALMCSCEQKFSQHTSDRGYALMNVV